MSLRQFVHLVDAAVAKAGLKIADATPDDAEDDDDDAGRRRGDALVRFSRYVAGWRRQRRHGRHRPQDRSDADATATVDKEGAHTGEGVNGRGKKAWVAKSVVVQSADDAAAGGPEEEEEEEDGGGKIDRIDARRLWRLAADLAVETTKSEHESLVTAATEFVASVDGSFGHKQKFIDATKAFWNNKQEAARVSWFVERSSMSAKSVVVQSADDGSYEELEEASSDSDDGDDDDEEQSSEVAEELQQQFDPVGSASRRPMV